MNLNQNDKWIPWPGIGQVNKKPIASIVDNHYFRRLSDKRQLSLAYLVFPGATHDRRQHSLGAYYRTSQFTAKMVKLGVLTSQEEVNLNLYALLHDIGHGPLSHVIEVFTERNHHTNGLKILDKMVDDIEACGGDLELIKKYMSRQDPKGKIVDDKNFGMEKLDYLIRDQESTQFGPNIRYCVESVFNHLDFRDGQLAVDLKALDSAMEIQRAYIYFYRNVHLEKSNYLIQRFMQKLIYQLLHTSRNQGGIGEDELWEMVDGDLIHALKKCQNESVRNGIKIFDSGVKHFPKTAISIRLKSYGWLERRAGKSIDVYEADKEFFERFYEKSSPRDLEIIESQIAKALGLESWQVAVSHIVERDRFIPQDILFFDGPKTYSLKEKDPAYFNLLDREVEKYLCVRICAVPEHRQKVTTEKERLLNMLLNYVK
ncbi:MAG: HD domain-containing protein [Candidatus Yanofskybacteria bacterium]|nr:HD domain-containing protein [Candidatus Yanofskybacteria bacterium]